MSKKQKKIGGFLHKRSEPEGSDDQRPGRPEVAQSETEASAVGTIQSEGLLDLPDEIVLNIFGRIPLRFVIQTMSPTCRRIFHLCHSAVLWRQFSLSDTGIVRYNNCSFNGIFGRHCMHFSHLFFNGHFDADNFFDGKTKIAINEALGRCCNLTTLDLTGNVYIEDISFLGNIKNLNKLYLEKCVNVDPEKATQVLKENKSIEVLHLRGCTQFSEDQLITVGFGLPRLKLYNIEGCGSLSFLKAITLLNGSANTLEHLFLTPDLDEYPLAQWQMLNHMFCELRLC